MDKSPATATRAATSKKLPKKIIALKHLMSRSLTTLEALSLYGETALHSTVSELANTHGLDFNRVREPHINQAGSTVYFVRYALSHDSVEAAHKLIELYDVTPRDREVRAI